MRPSIRIFDTSFKLLAEIDDYESLQLTRHYYTAGEFEMRIALGKQHVEQLQKDRILMINNQPHKSCLVRHREVNSESGLDVLTITGPTLGGILDRRIIETNNYDRIKGPAETVMKHYVNGHIGPSSRAERRIEFIQLATDQGRGIYVPWQTRYENLLDVVNQIAEWCDMGWAMRFEPKAKRWTFDVIEGNDLTIDQRIKPPVIFSHEFENIESQSFIDSDNNYKNTAYAGGAGEDEERLIQVIGSAIGFDRREVFLDLSQAIDAAELRELGEKGLGDYQRVQTFDGKILDTNSFQYEKDWDLGDIVTLDNKLWGLRVNKRITEIREIYEPASKIEVSFGKDLPGISEIVRKTVNAANRKL